MTGEVLERGQHGAALTLHRRGDSSRGIRCGGAQRPFVDERVGIPRDVSNDSEVDRHAQALKQSTTGGECVARGIRIQEAQLLRRGGGVGVDAPDDASLLVDTEQQRQAGFRAHSARHRREVGGRVGNVVTHEDETADVVLRREGLQRPHIESWHVHHEHGLDLLVEGHDAQSSIGILHDRIDRTGDCTRRESKHRRRCRAACHQRHGQPDRRDTEDASNARVGHAAMLTPAVPPTMGP